MQIEIIKSKSRVLMAIVVVAMCMFIGVAKVDAVEREDPAVGTASPEIENMIAHGKSIVGKTPYVYGGGHGNWSTQKNKAIPDGLDCSSFVSWALYRGMGIGMGGRAQTTDSILSYVDIIGTGSYDNAKRGDFVQTPGHIEIYLGKNDSGEHVTLHAQNANKGLGSTLAYWGQGSGSVKMLRVSVEDAKAGKNGLDYDESRILETGAEGVATGGSSNESSTGNMVWGDFDEAMLFQWLDPIVDFKGSSNTHSESKEGEKTSKSKSKGLKGDKGGIFSGILGK